MRIVFFGSSGFSVPALKAVADETVCVVTRKAKPKGRGLGLDDNEVKKAALDLNLPLLEIDSFRDPAAQDIPGWDPDLFVVASFGLIVPKWVLDIPSYGPINVHPSLLPLYRGPAPMQWAILSGDEMTGITLIRMNEKMDEGDIVYQEKTEIREGEDFRDLSERLAHRVAQILPGIIDTVRTREKMIEGEVQDHSCATYTPVINKEMGRIDWQEAAEKIGRQVRAFISWPTAYTFLDGKMLKIFEVGQVEVSGTATVPGEIIKVSRDGIHVNAGQGSLIIKDLQMENKKRMKAYDFAQGRRDLPGKVLGRI